MGTPHSMMMAIIAVTCTHGRMVAMPAMIHTPNGALSKTEASFTFVMRIIMSTCMPRSTRMVKDAATSTRGKEADIQTQTARHGSTLLQMVTISTSKQKVQLTASPCMLRSTMMETDAVMSTRGLMDATLLIAKRNGASMRIERRSLRWGSWLYIIHS